MKVCSLYGAGYYYMPGTDICIKLGGYVRWQISMNPGSTISFGPHFGQGGRHTRADSVETAQRTRALITVDTRQQTAYGTLRTYILLGYSQDSTIPETTSPPVYMTRGFIQIAGFTFGKATSFFDVVPGASFAYNAGMFYHPDTGDAGKMLAAYTAQFGNGVSGTIALEQSRNRGVVRSNRAGGGAVSPGGALVAGDNPYSLRTTTNPIDSTDGGLAKGVSDYPDLVGNIRIDQSWGTWLVGAAARRVQGQYFGSTDSSGGPDSKIGWAVTTGFVLNLPMIAPGDRLSMGVVYAKGATGYAAVSPSGSFQNKFDGNTVGFGFWEDGIYAGNVGAAGFPCGTSTTNPNAGGGANVALPATAGCGDIQLTTAFSMSAAFEHLWTPSLKTSLYGSYVAISHNDAGKFLICNSGGTGASLNASGSVFRPGDPTLTGCDPDWSAWNVGSRTQWEPVKGLIMGVDVIYNKLNTAKHDFTGLAPLTSTGNPTYAGGKQNGNYVVADQDSWMGTFRVQRDFLP